MGRTAALIVAAFFAAGVCAQQDAIEATTERARNAQGGLFGLGRTIQPGDKDYNRGSLNRR